MMTNEEVLKLIDALCSAPAETDAAVWQDKLFRLLEVAVRTLDCELLAVQTERQAPNFPLEKTCGFPLPEELAPAAAFLAAYLAGGGSGCKSGYEKALQGYLYSLNHTVGSTADCYTF